jgi:glycosyltransferase involved in cell wall biosynthesis
MKKIIVVQPLVPFYSFDFFNLISEENTQIELHVIAEINSNSTLNQFDSTKCNFIIHQHTTYIKSGVYLDFGLKTIIDSINPDVIVFSGNPRAIMYLPLMLLYRLKGLKVHSWGMFHRIGGPKLLTNLMYRMYSKVSNSVLPYSTKGALNLASLGVTTNKINIMGTAINENAPIVSKEQADKLEIEKIRVTCDLKNCKVVLQVVRLTKIKKTHLLIEVAKIICINNSNNVKFILIGDGDQKTMLLELIQKYKLSNNVILLGAIYDENILSNWYSIADVFAIPTCIGLSAHHAMAYSLPIVTDDSLNQQASEFDVLSAGLNSLIYKEDNLDDFAEKIMKVVSDDDLRKFLSVNALHTVTEIHSLKNKVNNFIKYVVNS